MSVYGCNGLVPYKDMVFENGGLTTNALLYEVDPVKPEYSLTFRIIVRSIKPDKFTGILRKGTDKELHRSPSIWLNPGSTTLHCCISTVDHWSEGINASTKSLILGIEHHIALVLSDDEKGKRLLLYIDGECDSTHILKSKVLYRKDMPFTLGGNAEYESFNGVLDRPRFYNYGITDEVIIREDMMSKIPLVRH